MGCCECDTLGLIWLNLTARVGTDPTQVYLLDVLNGTVVTHYDFTGTAIDNRNGRGCLYLDGYLYLGFTQQGSSPPLVTDGHIWKVNASTGAVVGSVVDTGFGGPVTVSSDGEGVVGIRWNPHNQHFYAVNYANNIFGAGNRYRWREYDASWNLVNTVTAPLTDTTPQNPGPPADRFFPDGFLILSSTQALLSQFDASGKYDLISLVDASVITQSYFDSSPHGGGTDIDTDGTYVYVGTHDGILVYDMSFNFVTQYRPGFGAQTTEGISVERTS